MSERAGEDQVMNATEALREIDVIYASLPTIECKRLCYQACGPIGLSRLEWRRIQEQTGAKPRLAADLTCPLLKDNLCSVYKNRPLLCRIYGMTKSLMCPHGCVPSRWIEDDEAELLFQRVESLGRGIFVIMPTPKDMRGLHDVPL
jgi:hypothetical protein